jgi:hypothetical protein
MMWQNDLPQGFKAKLAVGGKEFSPVICPANRYDFRAKPYDR